MVWLKKSHIHSVSGQNNASRDYDLLSCLSQLCEGSITFPQPSVMSGKDGLMDTLPNP
jgi:hypothetical protein